MWLFCSVIFLIFHYGKSSYTYDHAGGYLRDVDPDWAVISGRAHQPKCIDIPEKLTLCRGIGYTQMRLPNLLGHDDVNEVIQQAKSWVPLLGIHCHQETQLFLCSLFSPVCLDRPIYPCRSLCESVKSGCEHKMAYYGYNWPEMVWCNKFPNDSDLCIQAINNNSKPARNLCDACVQPETFEGLVDNYCRATYVIGANIKRIKYRRNSKQLKLKKRKMIKKDGLTKRDRRKLNPLMENVHCECDRINLNISSQKYIIMGNKTADGVFTISYMGLWRKDKAFRTAVRAMKKKRIPCKKDILRLADTDTENRIPNGDVDIGKKNKKKRNRKKKKNKKNKRKRGRKKGRKNRRRNNADNVANTSG